MIGGSWIWSVLTLLACGLPSLTAAANRSSASFFGRTSAVDTPSTDTSGARFNRDELEIAAALALDGQSFEKQVDILTAIAGKQLHENAQLRIAVANGDTALTRSEAETQTFKDAADTCGDQFRDLDRKRKRGNLLRGGLIGLAIVLAIVL